MRNGNLRTMLAGLMLASALMAAGESGAQTWSLSMSGAPASITCTNTSVTIAPGVNVTWSLPSAATQVHQVGTVGATTILDSLTGLPGPAGTLGISGTPPSFASTPFPYTFKYTLIPVIPGFPGVPTTSSFSFLCASAVGTNFAIVNGGPFSTAIPTLSEWGLLLLATLLAASAVVLLRRRLARK
jgi:hypothetical protein